MKTRRTVIAKTTDMMVSSIELRNGVQLPSLGLGTFKAFGADVKAAVATALKSGIRHIDTASIYKNETLVAEAVQEWCSSHNLPREEVFITSKLSPYQQGTSKAMQGCLDMVAKLGSPVSLALIHWPGASGQAADSAENARLRLETWRVLEDLYEKGVLRAIGVSNFEVHHLQQLMPAARVQPMVNQFEVHPRRQCKALRQFCAEHGIAVVAYSPLGAGQLTQHPVVLRLAQEHGRSAAQVLLAWSMAEGCATIPKSIKPERIQDFAHLLNHPLRLSGDDMMALNGLEDGHKYCWDPSEIA